MSWLGNFFRVTDLPERSFWCWVETSPPSSGKECPPNKQTTKISGSKSAFGMALMASSLVDIFSNSRLQTAIQTIPSTHIFCQAAAQSCVFWSCFLVPWQQKSGWCSHQKTRPSYSWNPNMNHALKILQAWDKDLPYTNKTKNDLNIPQVMRIHLDVRCHKNQHNVFILELYNYNLSASMNNTDIRCVYWRKSYYAHIHT